MDEASLAVSLAGGDSFSDIYGFRRLLYVCLPQFIVLALGKPLVLLPQTLGPFKARWAGWMARGIMQRARRVFSRDQSSLAVARGLLGDAAVQPSFSHDMGFALAPRQPADGLPAWLNSRTRPLVGLNVSGLLFMGGYTRDNMFGLKTDYPGLTREIIRWFVREANADVVLVTHVTGRENDAQACAALYAELQAESGGRLHLADPGYDHREIKFLIGRCDFFLGARMHACIAALSQGVPAVGLAYSRKFAGVFESVGVPELVVDLRTSDVPHALGCIGSLYQNRQTLARRLETGARQARESASGLFTKLRGRSPSVTGPDSAGFSAETASSDLAAS